MKKTTRILITFSLVLILSLAAVGSASAGKGGNPNGTITAIDETAQTMTLETEDGPITVSLPEGFDYDSIAAEMYVVVRGDWTGEDTITATTVKETTAEDEAKGNKPDADDEKGDDDDDDAGEGKPEGEDKGNHMSVYCTDKKENVHPMAAGIAETYGADEGEVMAMVCEGHSVGAIMLALQTQEMGGGDAAGTLAARKGGQGWGTIWKDAGLIGNEAEALPPGQAKKLENPGQGQDKDKDNPSTGGTPPGQQDKDNPSDGDNDDD